MATDQGDVVIGYVAKDLDLVKYIADGVRKSGVSVWYQNKNNEDNTDQIILKCKVFLLVLSEDSAPDANLRDQTALAYVSNKSVIPIAVKYFRQISPHLTGGLKLMLAKINWIFFVKQEKYAESLAELCDVIKVFIAQSSDEPPAVEEENNASDGGAYTLTNLPVQMKLNRFTLDMSQYQDAENETSGTPRLRESVSIRSDFWDRHFEGQLQATWVEFKDFFIRDYGPRIERQYEEDTQRLFLHLMYKDIFQLNKAISRATYDTFTGQNTSANPDLFYKRLEDYVIGYYAMREVFDMESTVRLTAVGNLGSFQTPSVIAMLFELIDDDDPNVRAIAALALAKTGQKLRKIEDQLINLLRDEDRLVRESACLSLAHIRCERSTSAIVDLWRNDAIKHVRDAAEVALKRMGSEEAKQAVYMTEVLTDEMAYLRATKKK